jgi:hypothetical protein
MVQPVRIQAFIVALRHRQQCLRHQCYRKAYDEADEDNGGHEVHIPAPEALAARCQNGGQD